MEVSVPYQPFTSFQTEPIDPIGGIFQAKRMTSGAGHQSFKVTPDGVFAGSENFADAPFRVDYEGNLTSTSGTFSGALSAATGTFTGNLTVGTVVIGNSGGHYGISLNGTTDYNNIFFKRASDGVVFFRLNYGGANSVSYDSSSGSFTVTGGTITGGTIQTATSGYRLKLNGSNNKLEFLSNDTVRGYATISSDGDLRLWGYDDIRFVTGSGQDTVARATSSGIEPDSDSSYDLGDSNNAWRDVYSDQYQSQGSGGDNATIYVATSSGGGVTHAVTIKGGIITNIA